KSKLFIYIATSLAFLAVTIIGLFAALKLFHLNIIAENLNIMQQSIEQSKSLVNSLGEPQAYEDRFAQMADAASQMYSVYLPSL
ncbi:YybS family protein, partial [[Eubacterium] rectale]